MRLVNLTYLSCVAAALIMSIYTAAAHAACTGPVGDEGVIIYNSDFQVMQYCRDSVWTRMDGVGLDCSEGDGIVLTSAGWDCSPGGLPW